MLKVSIIVPVFNAEKHIERCIESVLSQSYEDWELILIDDGSLDGSGKLCDGYSQKSNRIHVYHKENGGVSSARNLGMSYAKGEWITFVDADDTIEKNCIEICVNEIEKNAIDFLQFGFTEYYSIRTVNRSKPGTEVLDLAQYVKRDSFNVTVWGSLFRRDIIINNKLQFDTELRYAEDQIFVYDYLFFASRIKYVETSLYNYYDNEDSAVHHAKSTDLEDSTKKLIESANKYPLLKNTISHTVIYNILSIISNNDLPIGRSKKLYKKANFIKHAYTNHLERLLCICGSVNYTLTYCLIRIYYLIKK